ncbi:hypothetical protein [Lichenifustis flavocetrariae]|uniref:Uncharacterized protein n=1 Tax=Lichenifustis flavocetrariae TaxID=2949735 RepID=A0AA41YVM8_9HYPH|nr:hypothetical protein [Lichenifustis flavocetrariae]MCW6509449.1 hypothetical protein [Lichenifustis flavocetrariae]
MRIVEDEAFVHPEDVIVSMAPKAVGQPTVKVTESRAGRIVVQHDDGYVFVFQIHDLDALVMDLEAVTWSSIGAPPDADELEAEARAAAETEARAQGWIT